MRNLLPLYSWWDCAYCRSLIVKMEGSCFSNKITLINLIIQYRIPEYCSDLNNLFYPCNIDINIFFTFLGPVRLLMQCLPEDMQRTGKWTPSVPQQTSGETSLCWKVDRIVPFSPHYYLSVMLFSLLNVLCHSFIFSEDRMTCLSPGLAIFFKMTHNYVTVSHILLGKIHFVSLLTKMRISFAHKLWVLGYFIQVILSYYTLIHFILWIFCKYHNLLLP